ncbi:hypothetical protein JYU34_004833 [Plutella xylostella]|uniref:Uncharacterized protein n=1 Tax=Plutella xylostella TaxID=51655 RepID=A0ABQ7QV96_PLUXY|nr:uncharacterized protein LOC105393528 [Plutella xylostella]KAG7308977.1 hypothetical protein JYU34_004833 [Plutella xylostella]
MQFSREILQALAGAVTALTACLLILRQRRGYVLFAAVPYKLAAVESSPQSPQPAAHQLRPNLPKTSKMQLSRSEQPKFKKDPELELDDNTIFPYPCIDEN